MIVYPPFSGLGGRDHALEVVERYFDSDIIDRESAMCVLLDNGVDPDVAAAVAAEVFPDEVGDE